MLYPRNHTYVWLSIAILCWWALPLQSVREQVKPRGDAAGGEERIDLALQGAADSALEGREGTIIIMDRRQEDCVLSSIRAALMKKRCRPARRSTVHRARRAFRRFN